MQAMPMAQYQNVPMKQRPTSRPVAALVAFNRVGGVKQRMYYANLAEIRLPEIPIEIQERFAEQRQKILANITEANEKLVQRKREIEKMILGTRPMDMN